MGPLPFSPFPPSSHSRQEGLLKSDLLIPLTLSKSGLLFSLQGCCWSLNPCSCKSTFMICTPAYIFVIFSFPAPLGTLTLIFQPFPEQHHGVSPLVPMFLLFSWLWKQHLSRNTQKSLFNEVFLPVPTLLTDFLLESSTVPCTHFPFSTRHA